MATTEPRTAGLVIAIEVTDGATVTWNDIRRAIEQHTPTSNRLLVADGLSAPIQIRGYRFRGTITVAV
jgi:hypothetical protein